MLFLHSSLLESVDGCYNYKQGEILMNVVSTKISKVRERYNHKLADLIEKMLELNPNSRPDFIELSKHFENLDL